MVLAAKLGFSLLCLILAFPVAEWAGGSRIAPSQFLRLMLAALGLSRLLIFGLVFSGFGLQPASAVVNIYYPQAMSALHGGLPMRDIDTLYGPIFDFILAGITLIYDSPKAFILFAIIVEIFALGTWIKIGQTAFGEAPTRRAAALYLINPLAIWNVAVAGQNQVWLSLLLALALAAMIGGHDRLSGTALGFSIIAVKFLALLFAPPVFLGAPHRLRWLSAFMFLPAVAYGALIALGADPWQQVQFLASDSSSGNLPFLFGGIVLGSSEAFSLWLTNLFCFAILCFSFLAACWRFDLREPGLAVLACAFVLLMTLLVKGTAEYLEIALFPMALAVAVHRRFYRSLTCFIGLSGLAILEPSLWFRWLHRAPLHLPLPGDIGVARTCGFIGCEILLVAGYMVLLAMVWDAMARESELGRSPQDRRRSIAGSPNFETSAGGEITPGGGL